MAYSGDSLALSGMQLYLDSEEICINVFEASLNVEAWLYLEANLPAQAAPVTERLPYFANRLSTAPLRWQQKCQALVRALENSSMRGKGVGLNFGSLESVVTAHIPVVFALY